MEVSLTTKTCPKCGTALPPDAPQGLCPACLMERAWIEKPQAVPAGEVGEGNSLEAMPDASNETAGTVIGRYKLLEQVGEGGFGVVYMAEQLEPVRRQVALKIIKAGMDSKEVVARFEAERQALALMDHPNIAQVYDGGVTPAGRPYFVMELVRGVPITKYCDQRRLDTAARLTLFMQVCKAVQHAHQKGIIHRDLKPSNILVTHHESEPLPKIIDFGVAKALGQKLTDKTLFTGFLRMVGTPAYMSPEQAEFMGMDIDTRSDVYSLGVLLYELLTGVTPFDPETIRNAALDELRRMIRETDPPKPSTRLQTLGEQLDETARRHATDAPKLIHRVRGDLDWIVMKCLEKDRRRRYETVNGLAMDVQRHLENEPVVARPPNAGYRLQKFIHRNKLAFGAGSVVMVSLFAGLTIATVALLRERAARGQAELAEHAAEEATQAKQEQLWRSQLIEARYYRTSGQTGQRTKTLAVIAEAATWRPSVDLRNEAIAALVLPDLGTNVWFREEPGTGYDFACDAEFEFYTLHNPAGQLEVRRTRDHAVAASLAVGTGTAMWSQFSADGQRLAVFLGREDTNSRVALWDWRAGRRLLDVANGLAHPSRPVFDFTSDARELILATGSGPIRRFDAETGTELQPPLLAVEADSLRVSPSGAAIAIFRSTGMQVWSLVRSQQVAYCALPEALPDGVQDIAWHPHEELLAVGTARGLFLWKLGNTHRWVGDGASMVKLAGSAAELISAPQQHITHVFFNPNGDVLLAGGWENFCGIWDSASGRLLLSNRDGAPVQLSRDGNALAFARERIGLGAREFLQPHGLRRLLVPPSFAGHKGTLDAHMHPDGRLLLSAHLQGWLLWDSSTARIVARHRGATMNFGRFLPDGRNFATAGRNGVQRWTLSNTNRGAKPNVVRPTRLLPILSEPETLLSGCERIALSPDGKRFVAISPDSESSVYEFDSSNVVQLAGSEKRPAGNVQFSPDGRWVIAGRHHGTQLSVYDARHGQHVCDLATGGSLGFFHPDGSYVLGIGPSDNTFWRVGTWKLVRRVPWVTAGLITGGSGFSPDGRYYLLNDLQSYLRFRDAATDQDFATLLFPNTTGSRASFDSSGQRLLTSSERDELFLWDLSELRQELARLGLDWSDQNPGAGFVGE